MAVLTFYANKQKSIFKAKTNIYYGFDTIGTYGLDMEKINGNHFSYDYKLCFTIDAKKYEKAYRVLQMAILLEYHCIDDASHLRLVSKIATAAGLRVPKDVNIVSRPMDYLIALHALNENNIQPSYSNMAYRPSVA